MFMHPNLVLGFFFLLEHRRIDGKNHSFPSLLVVAGSLVRKQALTSPYSSFSILASSISQDLLLLLKHLEGSVEYLLPSKQRW